MAETDAATTERVEGRGTAGGGGGEAGQHRNVYVKRRASESSDAAMVSETQDSELMVFRAPQGRFHHQASEAHLSASCFVLPSHCSEAFMVCLRLRSL